MSAASVSRASDWGRGEADDNLGRNSFCSRCGVRNWSVGRNLRELEVDTEGLPQAVNEVTELASGAESWLSIAERPLATPDSSVWMGPVETDDTQGLRLLSGTGTKGVGGGGPSPFVWMWVGRRQIPTVH